MTQQIVFPSKTANLGLPLLFLGQSQKEPTINEGRTMVDMLLCGVVSGTANEAPADPEVGALWIVGNQPSGVFANHAHDLAGWTQGGWRFATPVEGMRFYNRAIGAVTVFNGNWASCGPITPASGGAVVDAEVRHKVASILAVLRSSGIISQS